MLERILPAEVAVVSTRGDLSAELFPVEEEALGRAVEKRRREFVTARACAREALARFGIPAQPIARGSRGEPIWPAGIVGSITHCHGYRACAVGRSAELIAIGVDVEADEPLPAGLLGDIARPEERAWLARLAGTEPGVNWDRLLFSIKESIYKAWFPAARSWLGFEDASVTIDRAKGSFEGELLVAGPTVNGRALDRFSGRWLAAEGLLVSAIAMPASGGAETTVF
jgi:4'-phosphopantetheinyl transferase EntD